jgi:hypothetical protein
VPEAKQKQVTVEVLYEAPKKSFFANRYVVERVGDNVVFHFGYRTSISEASECAAVSMSFTDLENQADSFGGYVEKLARTVDIQKHEASPRGFAPYAVQCANVMQLARVNALAETTFCLFSIHEMVTKKGERSLKAHPELMVRCELPMQFDMVCRVLELLKAYHEEKKQ